MPVALLLAHRRGRMTLWGTDEALPPQNENDSHNGDNNDDCCDGTEDDSKGR